MFQICSTKNVILVVLQDATLQLFLFLCHTPGTTVKFNPLPHNTDHAFLLFWSYTCTWRLGV